MKISRVLLIIVIIAAAFVAGLSYGRRDAAPAPGARQARKILYYVDPMHPAYKSDKPGIAPDCGMQLEPVYEDGGAPAAAPTGKVLYYRDPQQPSYTAAKPGMNPETGNDLEPVYEGTAAALPPGTFVVSPEKQQMIGVKYGVAELTTLGRELRAAGKVTQDETRVTRVHSKIEGWIEKVFVDSTGRAVKKGEPLLTLYSPEMLATQQEYLLALRNLELMKKSSLPEASRSAQSLVEAARRRLELWDLADAQIEEVRRTAQPIRGITLYSPASGFITTRNAFPGQRIMPDTELYVIGDLSRVWVIADVFEGESANVRNGQAAVISVPSSDRRIQARVDYILPQVDAQTRTLKVRLLADNPGVALKPDMFVDVDFRTATTPRLTVPTDAVLDSGLRKTVFVDRGNGHLEPRPVETGDRASGRVEITRGLQPGERIATSGTFLLDSEAQLKGGSR